MIRGNAEYDNFRKLNSSSRHDDSKNYNDKKLPINATTENNAAPIELSIIILICLGAIMYTGVVRGIIQGWMCYRFQRIDMWSEYKQ